MPAASSGTGAAPLSARATSGAAAAARVLDGADVRSPVTARQAPPALVDALVAERGRLLPVEVAAGSGDGEFEPAPLSSPERLAHDCSASSPALWAGAIAAAALCLAAAHFFGRLDLALWAAWARRHAEAGRALFVLVYAASLVLLLPASVLALVAGGCFGLWWGSLVVYLGNVLGQTAAFLAARHALRGPAGRLIAARWPAFPRVDAAIQREGWRLVFVLRLSPCLPYNLLNYALGLTGIGLVEYSWSSAISIVPYTISFVYLGCLSSDVVGVLGGASVAGDGLALPWALAISVLVASGVAYGVWFTRRALSAALEEALTPHSAMSIAATGSGRAALRTGAPLAEWAVPGARPVSLPPAQPTPRRGWSASGRDSAVFELASLVPSEERGGSEGHARARLPAHDGAAAGPLR